jgi:ParB-like chromosome segregation protein Spo0J
MGLKMATMQIDGNLARENSADLHPLEKRQVLAAAIARWARIERTGTSERASEANLDIERTIDRLKLGDEEVHPAALAALRMLYRERNIGGLERAITRYGPTESEKGMIVLERVIELLNDSPETALRVAKRCEGLIGADVARSVELLVVKQRKQRVHDEIPLRDGDAINTHGQGNTDVMEIFMSR